MASWNARKARFAAEVAALLLNAGLAHAQQPAVPAKGEAAAVAIDGKSIGGVVTSRFGPEAGVWAIR